MSSKREGFELMQCSTTSASVFSAFLNYIHALTAILRSITEQRDCGGAAYLTRNTPLDLSEAPSIEGIVGAPSIDYYLHLIEGYE